jgi:hypothetical protein
MFFFLLYQHQFCKDTEESAKMLVNCVVSGKNFIQFAHFSQVCYALDTDGGGEAAWQKKT